MTFSPAHIHVLKRLQVGRTLNGELPDASDPYRAFLEYLDGLSPADRIIAFKSFLSSHPDGEEIRKALLADDPDGPGPDPDDDDDDDFASLADIRKYQSDVEFHWKLWIPAASVMGIAAHEGIGKTRFALDLSRRGWHGYDWPDGSPATLRAGRPSLWVCADGQQQELLKTAGRFGMPDESIRFNTTRRRPFGGTTVDDADDLERLERAIRKIHPVFVFIDTMTNATDVDVCKANENKRLMEPLRDLAQEFGVTIACMLHLSKEGKPLGRRVTSLTRTLIQLDCPDPDRPERLKLWVPKSYDERPDPLGVTMSAEGNEYTNEPPSGPAPGRVGRPPAERDKATEFIREALTRENDQIGTELKAAFERKGGSRKTFWRGVDKLVAAGELTRDGGPGEGHQVVLHLVRDDKEAGTDECKEAYDETPF